MAAPSGGVTVPGGGRCRTGSECRPRFAGS